MNITEEQADRIVNFIYDNYDKIIIIINEVIVFSQKDNIKKRFIEILKKMIKINKNQVYPDTLVQTMLMQSIINSDQILADKIDDKYKVDFNIYKHIREIIMTQLQLFFHIDDITEVIVDYNCNLDNYLNEKLDYYYDFVMGSFAYQLKTINILNFLDMEDITIKEIEEM